MKKIDKETIKKWRKKGLTYQKIGEMFSVSRQRIHQILTGYRDNEFMKRYMRKLRAKRLAEIKGRPLN